MHIKFTLVSLALSALGRATAEDVPCLTADACEARGKEMALSLDLHWFTPGDYPTKGCFHKGTNLFFSPGTLAEMTADIPQGQQQRLRCDDGAAGDPAPAPGTATPCLTEEACRRASAARDIPDALFYADEGYATKGCYAKNGKAFFSAGTAAEMAAVDLKGVLTRIGCDDDDDAAASDEEVGGSAGSADGSGGTATATGAELAATAAAEPSTAHEGTGAEVDEAGAAEGEATGAPVLPAAADSGDVPAEATVPQVPAGEDAAATASGAVLAAPLGAAAVAVAAARFFF